MRSCPGQVLIALLAMFTFAVEGTADVHQKSDNVKRGYKFKISSLETEFNIAPKPEAPRKTTPPPCNTSEWLTWKQRYWLKKHSRRLYERYLNCNYLRLIRYGGVVFGLTYLTHMFLSDGTPQVEQLGSTDLGSDVENEEVTVTEKINATSDISEVSSSGMLAISGTIVLLVLCIVCCFYYWKYRQAREKRASKLLAGLGAVPPNMAELWEANQKELKEQVVAEKVDKETTKSNIEDSEVKSKTTQETESMSGSKEEGQ